MPVGELVHQTGDALDHGHQAQELQQLLHAVDSRPAVPPRTSAAGRALSDERPRCVRAGTPIVDTFATSVAHPALPAAGAAGSVLKDTPPAEILDAVRRVAAGDPVLSPAVTRRLMAHAAGGTADTRRTRARARIAALNDREREVAVAVGRGMANAAIAAELFMSVATVKTHVSRILAKLDLDNRVQIALLAYDAGLLDEYGEDGP
ncbi:response regulator transcription factor [Streptomyces sp. NPDC016675]|uniref:response regulator transcription factor n=1 Tax=Streptomyces sp. NPDC016675 TaxID=3364970 RepID=UPI0036F6E087